MNEVHLSYEHYRKLLDEIAYLKEDKNMLLDSLAANKRAYDDLVKERDMWKDRATDLAQMLLPLVKWFYGHVYS